MDNKDIYDFAIALGKTMPQNDIIKALTNKILELEKKLDQIKKLVN